MRNLKWWELLKIWILQCAFSLRHNSNWRVCGGRRMGATSSARTAMAVTVDGLWVKGTWMRKKRNLTFPTVRSSARYTLEHLPLLLRTLPWRLMTCLLITAGHFPCKAISKIVQLPTEEGWVCSFYLQHQCVTCVVCRPSVRLVLMFNSISRTRHMTLCYTLIWK